MKHPTCPLFTLPPTAHNICVSLPLASVNKPSRASAATWQVMNTVLLTQGLLPATSFSPSLYMCMYGHKYTPRLCLFSWWPHSSVISRQARLKPVILSAVKADNFCVQDPLRAWLHTLWCKCVRRGMCMCVSARGETAESLHLPGQSFIRRGRQYPAFTPAFMCL